MRKSHNESRLRVFSNCLRIGDSITLYLGKGDLHITLGNATTIEA